MKTLRYEAERWREMEKEKTEREADCRFRVLPDSSCEFR